MSQGFDDVADVVAALADAGYIADDAVGTVAFLALRAEQDTVLLVDKVDVKSEVLLLENLDEFQVSIPELGTVVARGRPLVALGIDTVDGDVAAATMGVVLKYQSDVDTAVEHLSADARTELTVGG